jgi:hypothetical protein
MDLPWYKGKEQYPSLAYELSVDHGGRIISCTMGFPGTVGDKTICRYDTFVSSVVSGQRYGDVKYSLRAEGNTWIEEQGAYLLVDQGYHRWRALQCPLPYKTAHGYKKDWSRRLESVRKDVECCFGRLKGRFRILKLPMMYWYKVEVDNVMITCCILHNILLRNDGRDSTWNRVNGAAGYSSGEDWAGTDGLHDAEDVHSRHWMSSNQYLTISESTDTSGMRVYNQSTGSRAVPRDIAGEGGRRPPMEIPDDLSISLEESWYTLQGKLITHHYESRNRGELGWGQ